ncbi:hypothetical protein D9M68_459440 [compost metagenome]
MGAQHAALFQHQADQLAGHASGAFCFEGLTADEVTGFGFPGNGPGHVRHQRRDFFAHVLAVEVHAGFQAQGVAGAEADGGDAGAHQFVEEAGGLIGGEHDFQAVFAGVTGTGDEPVAFGQALEGLQFVDQRRALGAHQLGHLGTGAGALDGQHGQVGAFVDPHVEALAAGLHPGQVLVAGGGIDHQAIAAAGEVDDQVVDHPAPLIEHGAVERLAGGLQTLDVVGQQVLEPGLGLGTGNVHHGHVGDVEDAAIATHLVVLLHLGTVVQRHVPAAEIDHLGSQSQVLVMQWSALSHGFLLPGLARMRRALGAESSAATAGGAATNGAHCSGKAGYWTLLLAGGKKCGRVLANCHPALTAPASPPLIPPRSVADSSCRTADQADHRQQADQHQGQGGQ